MNDPGKEYYYVDFVQIVITFPLILLYFVRLSPESDITVIRLLFSGLRLKS